MKKRLLQLALGAMLLLVASGVGESLAQEVAPQATQVSREQFTAIARGQLETVHYMAHFFRAKRGAYPKSLQELKDSPYWVVDLFNMYTGLPIEQLGFVPGDGDFASGAALPGGFQIPPSPPAEPGLPPRGGTGPIPPSGETGLPDQNQGSFPAPAPRRIDPARGSSPTPGSLLYWTEGEALQLVIFSDAGTWEELWRPRPYNYLADLIRVTETVRPMTDPPVAELAVHLERMLPGMLSRYLFLTGDNAPTPRELAKDLKDKFPEYAATLSMSYINPIKKRGFMPASYYSPGDLAVASWLPDSPDLLYFLQGERARTLRELIDPDTFNGNRQEMQRRDRLVEEHFADIPEKP